MVDSQPAQPISQALNSSRRPSPRQVAVTAGFPSTLASFGGAVLSLSSGAAPPSSVAAPQAETRRDRPMARSVRMTGL